MCDNILTILGLQGREDAITNLLAYCLKVSGEFREALLLSLCGQLTTPTEQWTVYSRFGIPDVGTPDLVLHGDGRLIVIEHKLKAEEGEDQTIRYSSPAAIAYLRDHFGVNGQPTFILLTLFPDQKPRAGQPWIIATHHQLLNGIQLSSLPLGSVGSKLWSDWQDLMTEFYKSGQVAGDDVLLNKLQHDGVLEENYLYFRSFMGGLKMPRGLALEQCFKQSQTGRRFYGAKISKAEWHPGEMMEPKQGGQWHLDPALHFNIHLELQFNVLNGRLAFYIHYETNPYNTKKWFATNVCLDEGQAYLTRRNNFIGAFGEERLDKVEVQGGCNQIAKVIVRDLAANTITAAAQRELEGVIELISPAIDHCLERANEPARAA